MLLTEDFDAKSYITEATDGKERQYFIEGISIQSNIKNRNGRVYPEQIVDREVARYIKEKVEKHQAVGELHHPKDDPSINYYKVSHKYVSLIKEGTNWIGKAKIANKTPTGSIVAGLMECGVNMGTSTRATGSTRLSEGVSVVQGDFRLITAGDIVPDPSAPDAYLTNLMEGKEWVFANGVLIERESEMKKTVNKLAMKGQLTEANMRKLFEQIMATVKKHTF